jgi:hypothetical protein
MSNHCKSLKEKLSYLDIFGQRIDLTYNNEFYYRTYYGAIYTLFIIIFLLMQIYEGYRNISSRHNPIVNTMELESDKYVDINLEKNNVTIALSFVSDYKNETLFDPDYFDIDIKSIAKSKNLTYDTTYTFPIELSTCNKSNLSPHSNLYETFNLDKAFCLNPHGINLYTRTNDYIENYIKITLRFCNGRNTCKNETEILNRLLELNFYVYIKHEYFDSMDIKNGIKSRLSFQKWTFDDMLSRKKDSLYLTMNSLKDYNSLFINLQEPKPEDFISFSYKDIVRNFKVGKSDRLMDLYIKANPNPVFIQRKYYTFIDLLANIGGLFNVFYILGLIIFGYVNRILFDCKIINDHFNIVDNVPRKDDSYFLKSITRNSKESNDFELKRIKDKYNIEKFSNASAGSVTNNNNAAESEKFHRQNPFRSLRSDEILKENLIQHRHRYYKFRYVLFDIVLSLCCIQRRSLIKKNQVYAQCKKIIDTYTDFKNIISTIQEFKIIRHVLFNNIQLDLINYYKKPVIQIEGSSTTLIYRKSVIEKNDIDICDFKDNLDILKLNTNSNYLLFKEKPVNEKLIELGNIYK